ncbi:MAG: lipoyl(octanoyl) transferase LipB [Desulfomonile tiedjei]|nr:lipoyl(octanoyl) transferase LipB [Desulfomonile tiedjei]
MPESTSDARPNHNGCLCTDLGVVEVPVAERLMTTAHALIAGKETPDLLLFLAHPHTVSLGLKDRDTSRPKDLLVSPERLEAEGIRLVRSVRGGGITYHWPGQVVCYPVMALEPGERDIPAYMHRLEEVCIKTLERFGLAAVRRRDTPAHVGLWVDGKKVVSMGVRISQWMTSFGFAVNLEGDHSASRYVRPCGIEGARLATLEELLGDAPARDSVVEAIRESFRSVFHRTTSVMPAQILEALQAPELPGQERGMARP